MTIADLLECSVSVFLLRLVRTLPMFVLFSISRLGSMSTRRLALESTVHLFGQGPLRLAELGHARLEVVEWAFHEA